MKQKIVNIIGLLGSLTLLLVLFSSLFKSIARINEGKKIVLKDKIKLEKIVSEKNKLEEQLKITESEAYVEKQLRNKLGLVKEGEVVVVLPEASIVKKFAPQVPEDEVAKPKSNWQKWLELFK